MVRALLPGTAICARRAPEGSRGGRQLLRLRRLNGSRTPSPPCTRPLAQDRQGSLSRSLSFSTLLSPPLLSSPLFSAPFPYLLQLSVSLACSQANTNSGVLKFQPSTPLGSRAALSSPEGDSAGRKGEDPQEKRGKGGGVRGETVNGDAGSRLKSDTSG